MTSFEWLIARRYLFSRQRKALISLISLISVGGVAVGVAALITVIGVIDGIDDLIFGNFSRLTPHVRIRGPEGGPLKLEEELLARLRAHPEVEIAQPVIQKEVVLQHTVGDQPARQFITLIGMDSLGPGTLYPDIGNTLTGEQVHIPDGDIPSQGMAERDSDFRLVAAQPHHGRQQESEDRHHYCRQQHAPLANSLVRYRVLHGGRRCSMCHYRTILNMRDSASHRRNE
jgi:hypothetical protein